MSHQKNTYRLPVLRGIFLLAGILLLGSRLTPRYYACVNVAALQYSRHTVADSDNYKRFGNFAKHHEAPKSMLDRRFDFDGSCVIVPPYSGLGHFFGGLTHFPALPEKLSFPPTAALSLRGPPVVFS